MLSIARLLLLENTPRLLRKLLVAEKTIPHVAKIALTEEVS